MEKCEHSDCEIIFGKILDIGTESVEIAFKERCNYCNKIIDKGSMTYTRSD